MVNKRKPGQDRTGSVLQKTKKFYSAKATLTFLSFCHKFFGKNIDKFLSLSPLLLARFSHVKWMLLMFFVVFETSKNKTKQKSYVVNQESNQPEQILFCFYFAMETMWHKQTAHLIQKKVSELDSISGKVFCFVFCF